MTGETYRSCKTFNGWRNHATWAVNLHIANDQGAYERARDIVARNADDLSAAGDALRHWVARAVRSATDKAYEAGHDWAAELLRDLTVDSWSVDWRSIAEGLLEE